MFGQLEHWKTYPPKSAFTKSDAVGYKGEKLFEQPLITAQSGEQTIPGLAFSYFNPNTRRYERAQTEPIKVAIGASLATSSTGTLADATTLRRGLRPDHPGPNGSVSSLKPLYYEPAFLAVPATLALLLAGGWLVVRPSPKRVNSQANARLLAELSTAAKSRDSGSFFQMAPRNAPANVRQPLGRTARPDHSRRVSLAPGRCCRGRRAPMDVGRRGPVFQIRARHHGLPTLAGAHPRAVEGTLMRAATTTTLNGGTGILGHGLIRCATGADITVCTPLGALDRARAATTSADFTAIARGGYVGTTVFPGPLLRGWPVQPGEPIRPRRENRPRRSQLRARCPARPQRSGHHLKPRLRPRDRASPNRTAHAVHSICAIGQSNDSSLARGHRSWPC